MTTNVTDGYVTTDKRQEVLRRLAASKCACDARVRTFG